MNRNEDRAGGISSRGFPSPGELADRSRLPLAALLSVVAGLVHLWVLPSHAAEDRLLGIAFGLTAISQVGLGAVLPFRPKPGVLLFGIVSNTAVLMAYARSRMDGLPFGAHEGVPEPIGTLDLASAIAEGVLITMLISMRASAPARHAFRGRATRFATVPVLLGTLVLSMASWAADDTALHAHDELAGRITRPVAAVTSVGDEAPSIPEVPLAAETVVDAAALPEEDTPGIALASCTPSPNESTLVAATDESDLFIYDTSTEERRRIIDREPEDNGPRRIVFRSPTRATFEIDEMIPGATDDADEKYESIVRQVDLRTLERTDILRIDGSINAYAWDPCGRYLVWTAWDGEQGTDIRVLDTESGESSLLRRLVGDMVYGRCGGAGDEMAVHWSPDGRHIALVMTPFDNARTLQVIGLDGASVVPPRPGTFPRWKDATTLIYRTYDEQGTWYKLNVDTGQSTRILARDGTYNIDLSPDGARAVYEDMHGALYEYTFLTGEEQKIGELLGGARWIGERVILASNMEDCAGECHGEFQPDGSTVVIDLETGATRATPLRYLWDVDVLDATTA